MSAEAQQLKVIEHEPAEQRPTATVLAVPSPPELLARAFAEGAAPDLLAKYMDVYERWEQRQAANAFHAAMAAAQVNMPVIVKDKTVTFDSRRDGKVGYEHASLGKIVNTIRPHLAQFGISFCWETQSPPGEPISVTCIVSKGDHSIRNTLTADRDQTGAKNAIQAIGSTLNYLERYTLTAALGLSAIEDDDGRASADTGEVITKAQADHIDKEIARLGIPLDTFLAYMHVQSVADIPAAHLKRAMHAIGASNAAKAVGAKK